MESDGLCTDFPFSSALPPLILMQRNLLVPFFSYYTSIRVIAIKPIVDFFLFCLFHDTLCVLLACLPNDSSRNLIRF